jgi:competence protein ComEC
VLWLPVLMGVGVVTYFALRREPPIWAGLALLLPALVGASLARPGSAGRSLLAALAAIALGLAAAQFATWRAPSLVVLPTRAMIITGIVRGVDPLPDSRRLLLEAVRLAHLIHRTRRPRCHNVYTTAMYTLRRRLT